ncbi:D-aminoacyl-tRNA deacylase [Ruminococcus flavefaciens]|uniref:D-aminoacyl-tRNA deacylase n=1 Tax=Ruminococcus flavefaciens TaxID=1265 RepID=A0A315XUQ0_RUMFL|nr:D-aminoacyl-tRNA deacylase [Ruminococcus flavefaciens]PWJ10778.1 D-tyrosyl-tRNA(Tyr) deacylase [Ruminococcus flavefaciens]SSA51354.1 D-tyrosyl-tRNA(Tyr) deacylase [Ruminococcus flavefaciens]
MRIVLQRVTSASVTVDGEVIGKIGTGFLLLFGVGHEDTEEDCRRLADKISGLRIFSDENDKINLDLESVGGEILVVPQFTLYADCRKGNRPNFIQAAKPEKANALYEYFVDYLRSKGKHVETGSFGADMKVELLNDGPFTVILE